MKKSHSSCEDILIVGPSSALCLLFNISSDRTLQSSLISSCVYTVVQPQFIARSVARSKQCFIASRTTFTKLKWTNSRLTNEMYDTPGILRKSLCACAARFGRNVEYHSCLSLSCSMIGNAMCCGILARK